MSAKFFCDVCGEEITPGKESKRLKGQSGRLCWVVYTAINGVWNGGHVCHDCIRDAVAGRERRKCEG